MKSLHIITGALLCVMVPAPSYSFPFWRSRLDPIPESSTDNVECFLDYMELWIPRGQMDGLLLWLSQVMRFPVSLSSLDRSNHLISRCRYALDMDSNGNFIFRAHYSACNVQTQNGFHVLEIHMVKKTSPGNGRSDRYLMRCPAVTAAMGQEKVQCDPNYVQVSRPMPLVNADAQDWFLIFRGELVVSVEDASLLGVEVEMNKSHVTVKGLREQLLIPKEFLDRQTDLLPLWIGHGIYAYSLEASCPLVTQSPGEEVTVLIPKQRMGLVKRRSYINEALTLRNIVVGRPINVTVTENKHFVMVNIPAAHILHSQDCKTPDNRQGTQNFYSIHVVLEFAEIAHTMNWTLENYYECTALLPDIVQRETRFTDSENIVSSANKMVNVTVTADDKAVQSPGESPVSSAPDQSRFIITTPTVTTKKAKPDSVKPTGTFIEGSGTHLDFDMSGSGDYQEIQINTTQVADLGGTMTNSSNGSVTFPFPRTLVTEHPNTLPHSQDIDSKISQDQLSNSTMVEEPKNNSVSSKMSSMLASTAFPIEIIGTNKTSDMKTSEQEETERTTVHSANTKVMEPGGSMTSSAVGQQDVSSEPRSSQIIPSSEKKPKEDADLWEVLIGDTLLELLDETTRDGFISPVHRHHPSRRSETESSERTEKETVHDNAQEKMEERSDVPHMADDSALSSHLTDWSIFTSLHEDTLYNSELESIGSAEHLIVEK